MLKPLSIFESLAQLFVYLLEDYLLGKYLVICSAVDRTQTHFLNSLIKKTQDARILDNRRSGRPVG